MNSRQKVSIFQEIQTSANLLKVGLGMTQDLDEANDFSHAPILLLSNGLERLLKITLCFRHLRDSDVIPANEWWMKGIKGHDVSRLSKEVATTCFFASYLKSRPVAHIDRDYLLSDDIWIRIAEIMTDFGMGGRYHNLNSILNGDESDSPIDKFSQVELDIFTSLSTKLAQDVVQNDSFDRVLFETHARFVSCVERALRAICRLYTIGELHPLALQSSAGTLDCFLCLRDDQLGRIDYRGNL